MGGVPPLGYDIVNKKLVVNQTEATQVNELFEKYLELQSVNDLTIYAEQHNINAKKWQTHKGENRGGHPIRKMCMHRILRDKTYIGITSHKTDGTSAPGEHEPIISTELFEKVQTLLANNANNKSKSVRSPNLLTGKLYNHKGTRFTNQRTCGQNKTNTYYYATKGFYLPAPQVDEVILETVSKFLDADLSNLPAGSVDSIKRIDWTRMSYDRKRQFIQSVVDKVIYAADKLIMRLNIESSKWTPFMGDVYINEKSEPMEFITNKYEVTITVPIVLRKYASTQFGNSSKTGVLTITDNNHLIVKAFATAWKYRDMYEQGMSSDDICRKEHISPRQFFRHLDLAYMNPNKVNSILSGEQTIKVNDLFQIAKENSF